jgi:hypothetical protein
VDFDFCDAGDDERRADDDGELVGSGVAFGVDVGTADVGVGRRDEEQKTEEKRQKPGAGSRDAKTAYG